MSIQKLKLTGSGGQGLILAGIILAEAALYDEKNVVQSQSYGPEARGGASRAEVIISEYTINYPKVNQCDIMLALTQDAYNKYINSLKPGGMLVLDSSIKIKIDNKDITTYVLPILDTAKDKIGKPMVANIVALGSIHELIKIISKESLIKAVIDRVPRGTEELNEKALEEGFNLIKNYNKESYGYKH